MPGVRCQETDTETSERKTGISAISKSLKGEKDAKKENIQGVRKR